MLTKSNLSQLMLIKIKYKSVIGLTIPIALFPIDELISAFKDLILILQKVFPLLNDRMMKEKLNELGKHITIENVSSEVIFELIKELFNEIRKHKGLKLIEVDMKNLQLMVKFY
ncbi:hypothetical protein [Geosporobacter ferrireducens]|uniref:hypothetical protein n=1 Tax=Geosporobacter ferrireducens TaxID=1424294 RepID=UPI0012EA7B75|nr:hypothetical protein [Geosporobacter ferrireducens]